MSRLTKVAGWGGATRVTLVFVHGLGGHAYDTWRQRAEGDTFWPVWLARDIPGLTAWTLAYEAPPTNWFGTAMPIQDRAKNVLECLLGQRELRGLPLVFVCHSLGGLVVKQVLRAADGRRAYGDPEAKAFLDSVKGIVFIATPHTGSIQATLLDKLRLIAWPSASTVDLIKNNANLRDLNVWYRNWSGAIRHKVFYEKQGAAVGIVVGDDSSDPGLLHVDPVGIDADHLQICKPADVSDLVYTRTRDFVVDEIIQTSDLSGNYGTFLACDLPELPRTRSSKFAPIALRLAFLLIVGLVTFKGLQAILFPPDLLGQATIEQIASALREKSPRLTPTQIDQFIQSLREARGDPSFERAVEEAKKGNTRIAEGIWLQIYEDRKKEQQKAQKEQAEAARNLAASAVTNNVAQGLSWYREATALDPDNMAGWLGLGDAALIGGTLEESARAFRQYILLARLPRIEREIAVGLIGIGDVLRAQGNLPAALDSYKASLAIRDRLAKADPGNAGWQRALFVSHNKIGDVLRAQGNLPAALDSYKASLAIADRLAKADPGNASWQRDLALSHGRVGMVEARRGAHDSALKALQEGRDIIARLKAQAPDNATLPKDLAWFDSQIAALER